MGADGVHIIEAGSESEFMQLLALAEIPGIGPKTTARLSERGLRTREGRVGVGHGGSDAARRADAMPSGSRNACAASTIADVPSARVAKSISRDETFETDINDDLAPRGRADGDGWPCGGGPSQSSADSAHDHRADSRQGFHHSAGESHGGRGSGVRSGDVCGRARIAGEAAQGAPRARAAARRGALELHGAAGEAAHALRQQSGAIETEKDREVSRAVDACARGFGATRSRRAASRGPVTATRARGAAHPSRRRCPAATARPSRSRRPSRAARSPSSSPP